MSSSTFGFQPLLGISLQEILQNHIQDIKTVINKDIDRVIQTRSEDEYINSVTDRFKVNIPRLDFNDIKKTSREEEVHGSELRGEVFWHDQMYRVLIVTFCISYTGNLDFIQYIPRSGSSTWWPEVFTEEHHLCFEVRSIGSNVERMQQDKKRVLIFLKDRLESATPELEEFNTHLAENVKQLFNTSKQKYLEKKRILDQL